MADMIEAGKKRRGSKVRRSRKSKSGRRHHRARKMRGGLVDGGNCGMYDSQGSQGRRSYMGGGAFELADAPEIDSGALTAGALEEAFQAGFAAGKRRRASRRKSARKSHKKSHKKSAKKSARRSRKSQRKRASRKVKGGDAAPTVTAGTTEPAVEVAGGEVPAPVDA